MRKLWAFAVAAVCGAMVAPTANANAPAPPAGFALTWLDDFTGPAG